MVPRIETTSSDSEKATPPKMTENEAKRVIAHLVDSVPEKIKWELFGEELIMGVLDDETNLAVTITWNDEIWNAITMSIAPEPNMENFKKNNVPVETKTSVLKHLGNSYSVEYGGVKAGTNKGVVFFELQNAISQFPSPAFDQLMQAMPKITGLSTDCDKITNVKLPTFKFSDHVGIEAFTLSKPNYFVRTNDNCCFIAVRRSRSDTWVIGAALANTHPIKFVDQHMYILHQPT